MTPRSGMLHPNAAVFAATVRTGRTVEAIACDLLAQSQWFEVTPLPGDEWLVSVKEDNSALLLGLADEHRTPCFVCSDPNCFGCEDACDECGHADGHSVYCDRRRP